MSVTTGSLGTTDVSASSPSLHGLDGINFFLAAVLAGFGPYVPAYLVDQKWTQTEIGLVLTAGSVAGLLSQLPGGELLDKVRSKRAVIAIAVCIVPQVRHFADQEGRLRCCSWLRSRLMAAGLMPSARINARTKWLLLVKPQIDAISASESLVRRNRSLALSMRW